MTVMTHDQYTELVGFLGRKFGEVQRHSTALIEQNRDELRIFAEGTNARFDKLDERFEGMDQRFEGMDQRFDRMDERLDRMDERFDTRLGSLEGWVRRAVTDHESRLQAPE